MPSNPSPNPSSTAARPVADNWDGPYYRPYLCADYWQWEWMPQQPLALNALDPEGCWLYTFSGFGIYRCGSQRIVLNAGQLLAYRSPDRGRICMDKRGLPWHSLCIHVVGEPALAMFDYILGRFGMFQQLPPDCKAVKLAQKLRRMSVAKPHRTAHFWSRLTHEWLDTWWECAEKYSPPLAATLRQAPHTSRLLTFGVGNVKNLAQQLGYSRSYLSRKLKWQWNAAPGGVIRKVRIDEAARLLRTTNLSVGDIATKLGFSATSAFTRAFRKAFGQSPLMYRKQHGSRAIS